MTLPELRELVLFGFLILPLGVLFKGWLRPAEDRPRPPAWLWQGSWCLAAGGLVWLALRALTQLGQVDPRLWTAPFERLLAAATLVGLGWSAAAQGQRWWRVGLAASLALALVAYRDLAPLWAQEVRSGQGQPGSLTQGWDYGLFLLGLFVLQALWRNGAPAPWATRLAVMAIGLGSFLQIVGSRHLTDSYAPTWARLGLGIAAACYASAAVGDDIVSSVTGLWRRRGRGGHGPTGPLASATAAGARRPAQGSSSIDHQTAQTATGASWPAAPWSGDLPAVGQRVPDLDVELGPELAAAEALRAQIGELGTHAAIVGLVTDGGRLELWHAAPSRPPWLVGRLPMADLPTLVRAMSVGNLRFDGAILAPDLIKLYVLVGSVSLPTLVQVIAGEGQRYGVIVAGRPGPWPPRDAATLERIANHTALRLAAIAAAANQRDQLGRVLSELETQAHVLGRLASTVDDLKVRLETRREDEVSPAAATSTAPVAGPAPPQVLAVPAAPDLVTVPPDHVGVPAEALDGGTDDQAHDGGAPGPGSSPAVGAEPPARLFPSPAAAPPRAAGVDRALSQRVALCEQALAKLPWAVVVVDADNAVTMANPAAARLLHTVERPAGQSVQRALPEGDRVDYALHRLRQAALTGRLEAPMEVLVESPAARLSIEGLVDPVMGYLGALVVATPRSERPESLLTEFIPLVTDALEQPIRSILGYREIWSKTDYSDDPYSRYLQKIDANLARMKVLLGDLQTMAQIELGHPPTAPARVDVAAEVDKAVEDAQPHLAEKAIRVDVSLDDPLPSASADPDAFRRILDNLLVNAAHRSPQGGDVRVTAEVRAVGETRALVISVLDRGNQPNGAEEGVLEMDHGRAGAMASLKVVRLLAERQGGKAWIENPPEWSGGYHVRLPLRLAA